MKEIKKVGLKPNPTNIKKETVKLSGPKDDAEAPNVSNKQKLN